jgi:hypothetical protein
MAGDKGGEGKANLQVFSASLASFVEILQAKKTCKWTASGNEWRTVEFRGGGGGGEGGGGATECRD